MAKRTFVDWKTFVQTFETSNSYSEVADKLKISIPTIKSRVYQYKKKGIILKEMPRQTRLRSKLDVDEVNSFLISLRNPAETKDSFSSLD